MDFPRRKPRSAPTAIAYRLTRLARRALGPERTTRLLLETERVVWRLAYEAVYEEDPAFPDDTYCVTPDLLAEVIPAGGTVLDVGCGFGRLCDMAAPYASRVVGIDSDENRIAGTVATASNIELRVGDVTADLADERFDVAILAGVLEHIDDPVKLLAAVRDRADRVVVEVPDMEADPLNFARQQRRMRWDSDDDHVREYTPALLAAQLAEAGWTAERWERRGKMVLAVAVSSV